MGGRGLEAGLYTKTTVLTLGCAAGEEACVLWDPLEHEEGKPLGMAADRSPLLCNQWRDVSETLYHIVQQY